MDHFTKEIMVIRPTTLKKLRLYIALSLYVGPSMHLLKKSLQILTFTILHLDVYYFENSVDLDQLASQKPADRDLHCFTILLVSTCLWESFKFIRYKINEGSK